MRRGGPLARRTPLKRSGVKLASSSGAKRRSLEDMGWNELEQLLDAEVSFYVRASRALKSVRPGWVQCYTCGAWHHWKDIDCGHYIPRHHQGTRYDLRNLRPQDTECNSWHEGEHWLYRKLLVEEIGAKEVESLELTASLWGASRHPRTWLIDEIKVWRVKNRPIRKAIKEIEEGDR